MTDPIWPEKFDPTAFVERLKGDLTPQEWQKLYMQDPVYTGVDLASGPDWTVRWNDKRGYYERRRTGGRHWERCS